MLKRHVFLAGLIVGSLALATPAYAGGSQGGRQGRDNPKHENPKQESPKHEDSKHNDSNGKCGSWTEDVRVGAQLTNVNVGHDDIDFTARNYYVDGKRVGSDLHFVAAVTAVGFGSAYIYNDLVPLSGGPHDRVSLNPTLRSGEVDATIQIVNLLDNSTHTITIRVRTSASVPAVFDGVAYVRHDTQVSGSVLRDGQPWFNFDHPAKPTIVQNWNASTCAPRGGN